MSERERVSLLQRGEGEDLVLLHGYLACKESFYYQIEALSARYRVTAFDFWGMGASAPPDGPWSVSDYAARTRAQSTRKRNYPVYYSSTVFRFGQWIFL